MGYLRAHDYNLLIQAKEQAQFTTNDATVYPAAEKWAQDEISSKLSQRYDVAQEFQDTTVWNYASTYPAAALVEINYPAYDPTATYSLHSLIIQAGKGYINTTAVTVPEAFNPSKWSLVGNQYDLYYAVTPQKEFNYKNYYNIGDKVFWKGSVYTCLVQTKVPTHYVDLQYTSIEAIPLLNVFPDDPLSGVTNWGVGVPYLVPANTLITNTTYWTPGDNRDQQCVNYMVILAIYRTTPRIAVSNVPANRKMLFDEMLQWLHDVSHGDVNVTIPALQPDQGMPVVFGGNVKRINQW